MLILRPPNLYALHRPSLGWCHALAKALPFLSILRSATAFNTGFHKVGELINSHGT